MIGDFPTEDVEAFEWNRVSWDERVLAHWESEMYRRHADALRAGGHGLDDSMISRVGELHGKSLIHLQCHMGMETLGWTRLGARAVGVDFSGRAIERAEHLRDELGLDTRFFEANVYDAPAVVGETFDVVFVSIGSICWLPDIARWARVVSAMLEPGGMLLMNDVHPMLSTLDDAAGEPGFALRYPYLDSPRMIFDDDGVCRHRKEIRPPPDRSVGPPTRRHGDESGRGRPADRIARGIRPMCLAGVEGHGGDI